MRLLHNTTHMSETTNPSLLNKRKTNKDVALPLGPVKPEKPLLPGFPRSPFTSDSTGIKGAGGPRRPGGPLSPTEIKRH